jgi:rhamnogalacturonyl hydrolase YesR
MKRIKALVIISLLLFVPFFSIFTPKVSAAGSPPIGYWKFDEGSGNVAHDSSGNGNDGTIYTATWTAGRVGSALHFNGVDSWVEVPTGPTLTGLSQITLEAWIQEDSITSDLKGIISKCDGSAPPINAEYFLGTNDNGRVFFETDNGTAIFSSQSDRLIVQAGRWYHVAGTWSGDSYVIYIDGQQVLSGTCTPQTTLSNSLPVQIGRHGTWSWVYFQGTIDEVKIYNYARTANDIRQDAHASETALQVAEKAATWTISQAIYENGGYKWANYLPGGPRYASTVQYGSAGFGASYLELYKRTGNSTYLDYAKRAAQWIISQAVPDSGGYKWPHPDDDIPSPGWWLSPMVSAIGDFLLEMYQSTGNVTYLDYATGAARWLAAMTYWGEPGCFIPYNPPNPYGTQASHGIAPGREAYTVTFLLHMYEETGNRTFLTYVEGTAEWLISGPDKATDPNGYKWAFNRPYGSVYATDGNGQIALFFFEIYQALGNVTYLEYAQGAMNWLLSQAVINGNMAKWLDPVDSCYRTLPFSGGGGFQGFWGIPEPNDLLSAVYEITNNATYLDYAEKLANWITSQSVAIPEGGGYKFADAEGRFSYSAYQNAKIYNFLKWLSIVTGVTTYSEYAAGALQWIVFNATEAGGGYEWRTLEYSPYYATWLDGGAAGIGYYLASSVQPRNEKTIFFDDFESYAIGTFPSAGGWELVFNGMGDQYQVITDAYCLSPKQSLQLWGNPGDWSAAVQKHFSSANRYIGYEVSMLISAVGYGGPGRVDYLGFFNREAGPWGKYYATVQFNHDTMNIITDAGNVVGTWTPCTWYKVKVLLDRSTNAYSVWIDEQFKGDNFNTTNTDTNIIDALSLQSDHPGVKDYFDDARVFEANIETTTLNVTVYDESGLPPSSISGPNELSGIPIKIYTSGDVLVATGASDSNGMASFNLQQGYYRVVYGGIVVAGSGRFAVISKMVYVSGHCLNIDLFCPEVTYHVYSEGGPFELNYVDLDTNTTGYQNTVYVQPGQLLNTEFSWWELETVNVPVWYVSAFGDWNPTMALGNLGSGCSSPSSHNLHTTSLSFNAPATPGTYEIRMVGVLDYDWPNSFYTHSHYQPSLGRDTGNLILSKAIDGPYAIGTVVVGGSQVTHKLTVSSAHDNPVPAVGDSVYNDGQSVTCSVTSAVIEGNTIWTCTGWMGTGSVPFSGEGSSVTFTITQDSSITWNWHGVPVQYGLLVQTCGSGTTNATGTTIYDSGTVVAVQAFPDNGWTLSCWLRNDTDIGTANPCIVTMNENINLTAVFTLIQPTQWKLTVSSTHDSPDPGNGDHYYNDGSSVTCSVTSPVTEGSMVWTCIGWSGSGSVPSSGSGNSVAFSITQDSAITWNWQGTPVQRTLTVSSTHGSPYPSNGPHTYSDGQSVTCSVTSPVTEGSTIWTCTGWTGTGSVPASGSGKTVTFTITQDSGVTWNWQGQLIYSVTIGAHCNTEGADISVSVWIDSSTMYYTPHTFANLHSTHTFTASQYDTSGHSFKQWNTGSTSLTITIASGGTYIAYYQAVQRTLTVSSAHDSPVPGNGAHTYSDGQSVTCSVTSPVTEGSTIWTCTGWTGTGSVPSSGSGTSAGSFTMTQDSSITWNWQARLVGDLILSDFSPVQVVYGASVLVANKPTVFRAIVQSTFSQIEPLRIRFTYSGGVSSDYLSTISPNSIKEVFISFDSSTLRQKGTFAYSARLDPDNEIIETNENNNMLTGSKTVIETNYLSVLYVPLRASGEAPVSTADLKLMEQYGDQYVLETYPTPGVYSQISAPQILAHNNWGCLLLTLIDIDNNAKAAHFDRTVVILPNKNGNWLYDLVGGPANSPGWTPTTVTPWSTTYWTICTVENTYYAAIPHELAHTYGRPGGSGEEYNTNPPGNPATGYDAGRKVKVENGLCFMASSAPFVKLGDALKHFTYGNPPHDYGDYLGGYWICNTCYEALLGQFKKAGDPEVMYMGGIVFENDTVLLPSWSRMPDGVPDLPLGDSGNCMILFLDDTGNLIAQTGFNASFVYLSDEFYITAFSFTVEYPAGTRKIQILLDDSMIVEKNVTLNSPTVSVVSPNGGEVITAGEECLISWNSSDLDGDQLTSNIFYSGDGGAHWIPIATDLNQTTFLWDTSALKRGSDYLLRVITTDGINTGEDISDSAFTIRVHDIAPSTVVPFKLSVGQNCTMFLNTTIENRGDFQEIVNVTLCANNSVIGTIENVVLSGENLTICFTWNTTGFGYGNYTISAYAWPVLGETNTADNNFTGGWVIVSLLGDITGPDGWPDGKIDMRDIGLVARNFGQVVPPANPNCDLTGPIAGVPDGKIDMRDIGLVARHFGEHL